MGGHLVIDGNAFYEIDEDCLRRREEERRGARTEAVPVGMEGCAETGQIPGAECAERGRGAERTEAEAVRCRAKACGRAGWRDRGRNFEDQRG